MFPKRLQKLSVTKQFSVLYLITVIVIMIVLVTIIYLNSHSTMAEIGTQNTYNTISASLHQLSSLVESIQYQLFSIQNNAELQYLLSDHCTDPPEVQITKISQILNNYDIFKRQIEKITLYSLTKDYYHSVNEIDKDVFRSKELENDWWFQTVLSSDLKTVFDIEDAGATTYVTASRVLLDTATRKPIAIVKAYINADICYSSIKNIHLMQNGRIFLSTNTHIINPYHDEEIDKFANNPDLFNKIIPNQIENDYIYMDHVRYLVYCEPVSPTGLYLIGTVDTREFNILGHSMIISTSIAVLLLMLFVFIMLHFISSSIVKPIKTLAKHISAFGHNDIPLTLDTSNAEIDQLYNSYNEMKQTIQELLEKERQQAKLKKEAEFRILQAQIKPHFLYNTLGSISFLADSIHAAEIKNLATSLATFFRTSLNNGKELITIRQELEHAISYTKIQKIRYPNKFQLITSVDETILDFSICKLILQPLIENCINYAFKNMPSTGTITIEGWLEGEDIILSVSDDGYGSNYVSINKLNSYATAAKDEINFSEIQHYGIYNVAQRINLYYGKKYGLTYSINEAGGITATIRLAKKLLFDY